MAIRKFKGLCVANAEINAKSVVCFAAVSDRAGILIDACVGGRFVITHHEGGAAAVPTTDFEHVFAGQIPAACYMMIELNRGPVGFIFRFERQRLSLGWPVTIVQKCHRVIADAPAEILIPDLPECLFEGWHVIPALLSDGIFPL